MSQSLSTKVALVTGGSRGIGAAIVRRLAADGAAVAFTYSSSEHKAKAIVAELEAAGGRALAIRADSADAKAVQDAVALTAADLRRSRHSRQQCRDSHPQPARRLFARRFRPDVRR